MLQHLLINLPKLDIYQQYGFIIKYMQKYYDFKPINYYLNIIKIIKIIIKIIIKKILFTIYYLNIIYYLFLKLIKYYKIYY